MKIHWPLPFLLALLLLGGCTQNERKHVDPVYPITVGKATQQDVPVFIESIGNVGSLNTALIRPQVGGIILETYVQEGQKVKKGDPLYQIDPRPYKAALEKAKAALVKDTSTLKFSEEQAKRYEDVVNKEFVSKLTFSQFLSQVDFNKGQVASDEADIALAELNLEWTIPISPTDGRVSQFLIKPGNLVVANDPNAVTDVRQITPADIEFTIIQKDFVEVQKIRQKGDLIFEAKLPQEKGWREGKVYFIDNHVNQATGTILLKGVIPNDDEFFWPGEFVHVRLKIDELKSAILVPQEAVKFGQEGHFVYIFKPETSTVEYRKVTTGPSLGPLVAIREGIQLDDQIVLQGQNNLLPGSKVYIPEKKG